MAGAYTAREYYDMIIVLGYCDEEAGAAVREYGRRFPNRRQPDANVIRRLQDHCRNTQALVFRNHHDAGRPQDRRNLRRQDQVLDEVAADPTRSTNSLARQFNISQTTVWCTLRGDRMHPYHYRKVQNLHAGDAQQRIQFCRRLLLATENDPEYLRKILWTDESIFTRDGYFNQHNSHHWAHENPRVVRERNHQVRFSLMVWAGLIGDELVRKIRVFKNY